LGLNQEKKPVIFCFGGLGFHKAQLVSVAHGLAKLNQKTDIICDVKPGSFGPDYSAPLGALGGVEAPTGRRQPNGGRCPTGEPAVF
jgi:hypothetical protein